MDILFWSGGKDSYLAYQFYKKKHPNASIALLTTYNQLTGFIPHQDIPFQEPANQADFLDLQLHMVPLPEDPSNKTYLTKIEHTLNNIPNCSKRLVFGDRLAPEIQNWRKQNFSELGYECFFPLKNQPLDTLLTELQESPAEIQISAVQENYQAFISVGDVFNKQFIDQLPDEIDPMGEGGEFHTVVMFS